MSIDVAWHINNQVIVLRTNASITAKDLAAANRDINHLLMHTGNTSNIHVLIDQTELVDFPHSLFNIRQHLAWMMHPKIGRICAYGSKHNLDKFFNGTLASLLHTHIDNVKTEKQALMLIEEYDPSHLEHSLI